MLGFEGGFVCVDNGRPALAQIECTTATRPGWHGLDGLLQIVVRCKRREVDPVLWEQRRGMSRGITVRGGRRSGWPCRGA